MFGPAGLPQSQLPAYDPLTAGPHLVHQAYGRAFNPPGGSSPNPLLGAMMAAQQSHPLDRVLAQMYAPPAMGWR